MSRSDSKPLRFALYRCNRFCAISQYVYAHFLISCKNYAAQCQYCIPPAGDCKREKNKGYLYVNFF